MRTPTEFSTALASFSSTTDALQTQYLRLSVVYMFKVDFEDFGYMFKLWTFSLCLAFTVLTPVEGQFRIIGSTQPIVASPGDDVVLPCHLDPELNVEELTVEWSRPDLKPDPSDRLSRVDYVHLYRGGREVPDMKIPAYVSRTELLTDKLQRGNISLKITNVTLADEGRYRCFVPKLKGAVKSAIVRLVVEPNSWTTETPLHPTNLQTPDPKDETDVKGGRPILSALISGVLLGSILLIFSGVLCAYLYKKRCQKPNHPKYSKPPLV